MNVIEAAKKALLEKEKEAERNQRVLNLTKRWTDSIAQAIKKYGGPFNLLKDSNGALSLESINNGYILAYGTPDSKYRWSVGAGVIVSYCGTSAYMKGAGTWDCTEEGLKKMTESLMSLCISRATSESLQEYLKAMETQPSVLTCHTCGNTEHFLATVYTDQRCAIYADSEGWEIEDGLDLPYYSIENLECVNCGSNDIKHIKR